MSVEILEKKINKLTRELEELKKDLAMLKKNSSLGTSFGEWENLSHQISRLWTGKVSAVEEIRYQRSKND